MQFTLYSVIAIEVIALGREVTNFGKVSKFKISLACLKISKEEEGTDYEIIVFLKVLWNDVLHI